MPAGQKVEPGGPACCSVLAVPASKPPSPRLPTRCPRPTTCFKPGSTPEARTYGQLIAHIAQSQFGQCSGLTGVANPMAGKNLEQELKTKAEVTKALAESLRDLRARRSRWVTDANATENGEGRPERADARGVPLRRHRPRQRDGRHRLRLPSLEEHRAAVHRRPGEHARPRNQWANSRAPPGFACTASPRARRRRARPARPASTPSPPSGTVSPVVRHPQSAIRCARCR